MKSVYQERVMHELCDISSSKRIFAADYQSEGVPFFRGKEITEMFNGAIGVSTELFIDRQKFEEIKAKFGVPTVGDLLLTSVGTLGSTYVVHPGDEFYFKDGNITWFRHFKGLNSTYLHYWLSSPAGKAEQKKCIIGSSQSAYTIVLLKEMKITLPPLEEQERIASILSAYDDLIENNTRRIAILEEMARRIYEEWFVHFRFPGHRQVKMVESELGLIPEGWTTRRLEEVCSRITDGSHSSPPSAETGKPMASVKDMTDWGINTLSCRRISDEDYQELVRNDCKPRLNDVLIAKDGSYLKHTFVVDEEIDQVILSSIAILRPNGHFLPNQLALYLRLPHIKDRMKGYVSGVAIPRIILKDFRQFLITVPSPKLQQAWAEKCDAMLTLCRKLVRKNANLRATRDLLLPKLISGELDVSSLPEPEEGITA